MKRKILGLLLFATLMMGCGESAETPTEETQEVVVADTVEAAEEEGPLYSIEEGGIYVEANAERGGRISSLRLNGNEFLSLADVHPSNWGSTFWASPQSVWGWPPPLAFDSLPYNGMYHEGSIALEGQIDTQKTGTQFYKNIRVEDGSIFINYTIKNTTDSTISVAPWEITRVPPNGLSFYKADPGSYEVPFTVEEAKGYVWFDYKNSQIQEGHKKLIGSANAGWLAHVNGNMLLVKKFPHSDDFKAAPNEGEIEIYANPDKIYIELEPQGEVVELPAGESTSWEVQWILTELPEGTNVAVGDDGLIEYVESLVN